MILMSFLKKKFINQTKKTKIMKTKMLMLAMVLIGAMSTAFGQEAHKKENKKEVRKAQKIAFITERLELTPEESKAFWPLYEAREKDRKEAIKRIKGDKKDKKKIEEMSDAEVKELLNKTIEIRQVQLNIFKQYNDKFLSVLPPKKVAKLYHLEKEFRKHRK